MLHVGSACKLLDVLVDLRHRDNRQTEVDTETLDDLILEGVWSRKENNFGLGGPPLQELAILFLKDSLQHF